MSLVDRLRELLGRKPPEKSAGVETNVPIEWLDAAQRALDTPLLQRDAVEQSRFSEAKSEIDTIALRQALLNHTSLADIDALAAQLEIDERQLQGGKGRQVMTLLTAAQQDGKLEELLAACERRWPHVNWQ